MSATEDEQLWFERDPERLKYELDSFTQHYKLPVPRHEASDAGGYVIYTELRFRGQPVSLRVELPYDYPDAPPSVYAETGLLGRHQRHGNLCALADPENSWHPANAAAELVAGPIARLFADTE